MYKQLSHEDLSTLETCQLLAGHEQQLKSAENYRECFLKLVQECPPFKNYLEKNIVPWPADWPGWYYPKKKIAQGKCQLLRQSVIPEQGQFHVSLNATEDTFNFQALFDDLYKSVFGQDLPNKSRTYKVYKVTICLTAALAFAKTMNLCQLSTNLNMCFPLYFSNTTFFAVEILYNMRI